jgi:hypothetical protein
MIHSSEDRFTARNFLVTLKEVLFGGKQMTLINGFLKVSRSGAGILAAAGSGRALPTIVAVVLFGAGTLAHAGSITINATFDPSLSAADDAAINAAIAAIESSITSPDNLTVNLYYNSMTGGLGESLTSFFGPTYQQYYNALAAVATQPNQLTALASLGPAPTGPGSGNPLTGSAQIDITTAEARNLGFSVSGGVTVGSVNYDSEISLNTSITFPPQPNNGSNYGLQAVANHETDEALGIGGAGSTIGGSGFFANPGDLDLYRYTCSIPVATLVATLTCPSGDASRTDSGSTPTDETPTSYFSINGGLTVLSFFNQSPGADYGDWLSDCGDITVCTNGLPDGFVPQVQDAFGGPATNPALGVNEITAFNAIGYDLVGAPTPEPSSLLLFGSALLIVAIAGRRRLGLWKSRQS